MTKTTRSYLVRVNNVNTPSEIKGTGNKRHKGNCFPNADINPYVYCRLNSNNLPSFSCFNYFSKKILKLFKSIAFNILSETSTNCSQNL